MRATKLSKTAKQCVVEKHYNLGSQFDYLSISEGSLIAGGIGFREGRQTYFFTSVDPMATSMHSSIRTERNEKDSFTN